MLLKKTRKTLMLFVAVVLILTGCQQNGPEAETPTSVSQEQEPTEMPEDPVEDIVDELPTLDTEIKLEWQDWYETQDFVEFLNAAFVDQMLRDPETITEIGLSYAYGLQDDLLTDSTPAYELETYSMLALQLEKLHTFDRETLSAENQLNYDLFEYDLEERLLGMEYRLYDFPINQTIGLHMGLVEFLTDRHPIYDEQTILAYIARIEQFPQKVDGWLQFFQEQQAAGIKMPYFNQQAVIWQINNLIKVPVEQNVLYTSLQQRLLILSSVTPTRQDELLEETADAIEEYFIPAYEALISGINTFDTLPNQTPGLKYQPGGEEAYQYALYHHTTTELSAEEIHRIGLDEVERIQAEMNALMDELGVPDGTLSERLYAVAGMSGVMQVDTQEDRQAILDEYQRLIDEANLNLDEFFDVRPGATVIVRPIAQDGATGAYYVSGSLDGSRPGTFYVGLSDVKPKYEMATLAYHEAVPGHHFQITIQNELTDVPYFRQALGFTAYAEGWALYAEYLMKEAGFYEDNPYGDIGRLQMELFRAARLVADTGLHHYGWSHDETIDYMVENTGLPRDYLTFEVERYILWPGQATSYKIGMLKVLQIRQAMQEALGDDFEIKDFHNLMIGGGAYPLCMMDEILNDYLAGIK